MQKTLIAGVVGALVLSLNAQAAMVTLEGDTVTYTLDTDDTGYLGDATVVGDTLVFRPTSFVAKSLNGAGAALTNETVGVTVAAKAGYTLVGASLYERGDYLVLEGPGGDAGAGAGVAGQFIVGDEILDFPASDFDQRATFSNFHTTNWSVMETASPFVASWVDITLQNLLSAGSSAVGTVAFVEKKLVNVTFETTVVPLPAPILLLGSSLAGLLVVGRRKNRV